MESHGEDITKKVMLRSSRITFSHIYQNGKRPCNGFMDAHEIRRINLNALVEKYGGPTQFGEKVGRSQSHISQLQSKKNMGGTIARDMEKHLGLDRGWFDRLHVAEDSPTYVVDEAAHQADAVTQDDIALLRKIRGKAGATGTPIEDVLAAIDIICSMSPDDRPSYRAIGDALVKPKTKLIKRNSKRGR